MVTKYSEIDFSKKSVIQRYIKNPFLINNRKFDLRIYVCVLSVRPLQVYFHSKGLVRFAVLPYFQSIDNKNANESNVNYETKESESLLMNERFQKKLHKKRKRKNSVKSDYGDIAILGSHLTNYFINSKIEQFNENDCKWTLEKFWAFLAKFEKEYDINLQTSVKEHILKQISSIIRNIFKICESKLVEGFSYYFGSNVKHYGRCFDILGLDILVDDDFRCWMLEINRYPSLKCETQTDKSVKYDMIAELLQMLRPRLICNHPYNIFYHHKLPVICSSENTDWTRVL